MAAKRERLTAEERWANTATDPHHCQLTELKALCRRGVPPRHRAIVWARLGHLPPAATCAAQYDRGLELAHKIGFAPYRGHIPPRALPSFGVARPTRDPRALHARFGWPGDARAAGVAEKAAFAYARVLAALFAEFQPARRAYRNTVSDRTALHCTQLRPGSSFLLSGSAVL